MDEDEDAEAAANFLDAFNDSSDDDLTLPPAAGAPDDDDLAPAPAAAAGPEANTFFQEVTRPHPQPLAPCVESACSAQTGD